MLAHSFERVMLGKDYVKSIRDFWRVCPGVNQQSRGMVERFLSEVLNVGQFPLTVLDRLIKSKTCKTVENSFRATMLAFMDEWSVLDERNGIDIVKVIQAINARPTHNNLMFPGPGIGGYCLLKDGGMGVWAYHNIMGFQRPLFNAHGHRHQRQPLPAHAAELVRDALRNMGRIVAASEVVVLGTTYREDVGDTRYSGSELVVRNMAEMDAVVKVHDPYVLHWWELEKQDIYPQRRSTAARASSATRTT